MTPIKQGMYEFDPDSLVEIRRRMGISQSKMAELLGVPANTLSRWETGVTVPDAGALAAVYSTAKEHGIDAPPFFVIRSPVELKLGSKPSDQPIDSLAFLHILGSYLNTEIELIGTDPAPVIKIEISNAAPVTPDWPKVVFMGVGLSLAHTGDLRPGRSKARISRRTEEESHAIAVTPWQNDSKMQGMLKMAYEGIGDNHKAFPDITSDEAQHGQVLFPGQSVIYEIDTTTEELPYLQFRVEGTVSRRHLFRCEETFIMPVNVTKPLALSALTDFNALGLHRPLDSVIESMPRFEADTSLKEMQTFSTVLSDNMGKIKTIQEDVNNIFRRHKFWWFRAHLRAAFIYLDRVNATLARMKEAIGSSMPDQMAAVASAIMALKGEADQLHRETQELMRKYNISDDEIRKSYVG